MERRDYVEALDREGQRLAAAATEVDLDAPTPTCPGWSVRDLVRHIGGVHRWATEHVAGPLTEGLDADLERVVGGWPEDSGLIDWFRDGHADLVDTISSADPGLVCWSFLPAPSPLLFWARRQTHETAIHRVDAESVRGDVGPCELEMAVDGIDELLFGFAARRGRKLPLVDVRSLHLRASDHAAAWLVRLTPDAIETSRPEGPMDAGCVVTATASDLYLLLWNRLPPDPITVAGDEEVLNLWRQPVRVRWT